MTKFQKVNIKVRNQHFEPFEVTRMDNGQKVRIGPESGFFAEKLGLNPGSSIQSDGPTFLCVETIEQLRELSAFKPVTVKDPVDRAAVASDLDGFAKLTKSMYDPDFKQSP